MLLFIKMGDEQEDSQHNFNTSHVTVYQQCVHCVFSRIAISIHLMLLFIDIVFSELSDKFIFQYISCYCLSLKGHSPAWPVYLFQYISCYCLSHSCHSSGHRNYISIHLMLLFIGNVHDYIYIV